MNKRHILASLNKVANELDNSGLYKEANTITSVMKRLAEDFDYGYDMGGDDPEAAREFNQEEHKPLFGTNFDLDYTIIVTTKFDEALDTIPASKLFSNQKFFTLADLQEKLENIGFYGQSAGRPGLDYDPEDRNLANSKAQLSLNPRIDRENKTITVRVQDRQMNLSLS